MEKKKTRKAMKKKKRKVKPYVDVFSIDFDYKHCLDNGVALSPSLSIFDHFSTAFHQWPPPPSLS